MEPLKDSGWKRSKLNKGGREISVVWHRAMGRANRSTESPFVPGSSSPPIHIQRLVDPKSYLGSSPIPFQPSRADGNALSKSVKSSADFVSPKFSRQWTMEYFAATRSLIGLAFNPNFHFRSLNTQLVLRRPYAFLPLQGYCFSGGGRARQGRQSALCVEI